MCVVRFRPQEFENIGAFKPLAVPKSLPTFVVFAPGGCGASAVQDLGMNRAMRGKSCCPTHVETVGGVQAVSSAKFAGNFAVLLHGGCGASAVQDLGMNRAMCGKVAAQKIWRTQGRSSS